jgi:hypothetical protein
MKTDGDLMNKIGLALILTLAISGISRVEAQELYSSQESSVDLFGFYGSRNKNGNSTSAAGSGVGYNYFFTQNFGVGADSYADAFTWPYLLNANGIFRYPIPQTTVAPYLFAGVGRQWWHAPQWMGNVGGGIEYRPPNVKPHIGFFTDVRGVFTAETKDYAVVRFGFRFILK